MRRFAIVAVIAMLAGAAWATASWWSARVQSVVVTPNTGDYVLTATNPTGIGTTTLTTGAVQQFHLGTDAGAGSHRISQVDQGVVTGDAVVYGQPVTGTDFQGTLPNPTLKKPFLQAASTLPFLASLTQGDCVETSVPVAGARLGMVATVTAKTFPIGVTGAIVVAARVSADDTVLVRECAAVSSFHPLRNIEVAVIQ